MKRSQHKWWAAQIGESSHCLLNYDQLPDVATDAAQLIALEKDAAWQREHHNETQRAIEALKQDIARCNYEKSLCADPANV
jgi:hypothetical protein